MSRFFYFGGVYYKGGVTGFFLSQSASNCPSRKGGVLLRSAFSRGATKGVGGQNILSPLLGIFQPEKKRIVGSEISHFRAMISLLYDYLLEKNFGVVLNTLGSGFLDSTAQSRTFAISFSIFRAISFPNFAFHF